MPIWHSVPGNCQSDRVEEGRDEDDLRGAVLLDGDVDRDAREDLNEPHHRGEEVHQGELDVIIIVDLVADG